MLDFVEWLTGESQKAPVHVPTGKIQLQREAELKIERMTDEILSESLGTLQGALQFSELTGDEESPPEDWVERLGEKEARKRFNLAMDARKPAAHAPFGLKLAKDVALGIMKTRSEKQVPTSLNVQFVQFQLPTVTYPKKKVDR